MTAPSLPPNYVPPTGQPLNQTGAQPYNVNPVFNDGLLATVSNRAGVALIYIRGPDFHALNAPGETLTTCRLVRVSDTMDLGTYGSVAAATARANAMVASGEVS